MPERFRTVTVTLPLEVYEALSMIYEDTTPVVAARLPVGRVGVNCELVREALEAGESVPGADLILDRKALVVK